MRKTPWTEEECIANAKDYQTRTDWYKNNAGAYLAARKNGWLPKCFAHMKEIRKVHNYWNFEKCLESAKKYQTRSEWFENNGVAYRKATIMGWFELCVEHMLILRKHHTKEECLLSAKKYKTRSTWHKGDEKAYHAAKNLGYFDECVQHMLNIKKLKGYWTKERCIEEAKKYELLDDWMKQGKGSFWVARKNNWFNECTAHFTKYYRLSKVNVTV
jgi:hypothetical protein